MTSYLNDKPMTTNDFRTIVEPILNHKARKKLRKINRSINNYLARFPNGEMWEYKILTSLTLKNRKVP